MLISKRSAQRKTFPKMLGLSKSHAIFGIAIVLFVVLFGLVTSFHEGVPGYDKKSWGVYHHPMGLQYIHLHFRMYREQLYQVCNDVVGMYAPVFPRFRGPFYINLMCIKTSSPKRLKFDWRKFHSKWPKSCRLVELTQIGCNWLIWHVHTVCAFNFIFAEINHECQYRCKYYCPEKRDFQPTSPLPEENTNCLNQYYSTNLIQTGLVIQQAPTGFIFSSHC